MKKLLALFVAILMLATLVVPASAAKTGEWVDEIVDYAEVTVPEMVDISQFMCFENNIDLGITQLVKADENRNPIKTEYIVYQMADNIAGFELFVNCTAGLGDPIEDISVFVGKSKDGPWTEVRKQATELFYNDDIYLGYDFAYWHHAYVMNDQRIPKGYTFLKLQLNACNEKGDVPWNVAIDTVKIVLGTGVAVPKLPTVHNTKAEEEANKPATTTTTTKKPAANKPGTTTTTKAAANKPGTTTTTKAGAVNTPGTTTTTKAGAVNTPGTTTKAGAVVTQQPGASVDAQQPDATQDGVSDPTAETPADTPVDGNTDVDTPADTPVDGNAETPADGNVDTNVGGGVVVLTGAAVAVYFFVLKKKA